MFTQFDLETRNIFCCARKSKSGLSNFALLFFIFLVLFSGNAYSEMMCTDTQTTANSGSITDSGGSNGKYSNNENCGFLIQPASGGEITLIFSSFNYEYYYDSLTVYEGSDASGRVLGSFTGRSFPPPIVSTVGSLYIVHSSDYSKTRSGFIATWSSNTPDPDENRICREAGSALNSGKLTDPGGALAYYDNNQNCGFLIQPTDGGDITLAFSEFDYENFYDDLRIYDGTDSNAPRIAIFTGSSLPDSITATSGAMYIVHDTDYSVTRPGFNATWTVTPLDPNENRLCRDFFSNESTGHLTDPGGPLANYSNDQNCGFLIQPTVSGDITLTFSEFDYEKFYDYLTIYDGTSSAGIELGALSGTSLPKAVTASSGAMYIVHDTDYSVTRAGLGADWSVSVNNQSQCAASFPDGLSTHGTGVVTFGYNARLIGSDDNLLAATSITKNNSSTLYTCNTADCSSDASGLVDPISPGSFQSTLSIEDVSVASQGTATLGATTNEYRNVSASSQATINFDSAYSEYFIDQLSLGYQATLTLQANTTYWINNLITSENTINVAGSGTATLITNNGSLQLSSASLVNSPSANTSGDASKLAIYSYGDIVLSDQTTVSAIVYARGSITLVSASYIFGAATADSVNLDTDSSITYQSSGVSSANFNAMCATPETIDHYRIEYSSDSLTCDAPLVTVRACKNILCSEEYSQKAEIDLNVGSGFNTGTLKFTGNTGTYIGITTPDTYTISQNSSSPTADLLCYEDGQLDSTCNMKFVDAGFQFFGATKGSPLPTQTSETTFSNVNLRAVKNDGSGACAALLTGNKEVTLGYSCVNPGSCQTAPTYTGLDIVVSPNISLNFDAEGIAPVDSLNYADTGRINLTAQAVIDTVTINSGNGEVDVIPDKLQISASMSPGATLYKAGEDFTFEIEALGSAGSVLKNYQPGNLQIAASLVAPATHHGSVDIGSSTNFSTSAGFVDAPGISFTGTYSYSRANYTEVGSIQLALQDTNYLNNNYLIGADGITVSSFAPAYFVVTPDTAEFANSCSDNFTYIGQAFGFADSMYPRFNLTAKNAFAETTLNYEGSLWHYSAPANGDLALLISVSKNVADTSGYDGVLSVDATNAFTSGLDNIASGTGSINIEGLSLTYQKTTSELIPFDVQADLTVAATFLTDTDGICYQPNYVKGNTNCENFRLGTITGVQQRYGRARLTNAYGPETESLPIPFEMQYIDNTGNWQLNADDICSAYAASDVLIQSDLTTSASGSGTVVSGAPLSITAGFYLSAPQAAGKAELTWQNLPPWLQYDWDKSGLIEQADDPTATATFGLYRGNDKIIHWREVFD